MKKFGLLCLALVLAVCSLGVSYALWYDVLYFEGTVQTGTVDVEWYYVGCHDHEGKDVATITGEIDPQDPNILYFTINNGYPCYTADCEVEFWNVGTVPVIIENITVTPGVGTTLASDYGANDGHLYVIFVDGIGVQLRPCPTPDPIYEPCRSASSIRVHVEQMAEQNATYTFTVEIEVVQYNESIWY